MPLHLVLTFDEHYPSTPPAVLCTVRFPHANCYRRPDGTYSICLDMLEPPTEKGSPYSGWSSAMSVLSILLQLQSFLTLKKLHYAEGMGTMQRALGAMGEFVCPAVGCSHRGSVEPWPALREHATLDAPRRLVCRPCGSVGLAGADKKPYAPSAVALPTFVAARDSTAYSSAKSTTSASAPKPSAPKPSAPKASAPKASAPKALKEHGAVFNQFAVLADDADADLDDEPGTSLPGTSLPSAGASAAMLNGSSCNPPLTSSATDPGASASASKPALTPLSAFVSAAAQGEKAAWEAHVEKVVAASKAPSPTDEIPHANAKSSGKAALKNAQRARRRAEKRAAQMGASPTATTAPPPPSSKEQSSKEQGEGRGSATTEDGTLLLTSTSASTLGDDDAVLDEATALSLAQSAAAAAEAVAAANAGCFGSLGYDALVILMERLHSQVDVRALACTCKHLSSACEDGLLWRVLFAKHYPRSQLSAATLADEVHVHARALVQRQPARLLPHQGRARCLGRDAQAARGLWHPSELYRQPAYA